MTDTALPAPGPQAAQWTAPKLEKLGTMRDVAASLNAPGNGNSANGHTPPS